MRAVAVEIPQSRDSVHVELKGSLDIPLNLGLLTELGDPLLEQEVIKEAVRIAVSERLGFFEGIDVRISSSGGRDRFEATKPLRFGSAQQLDEETSSAAASALRTRGVGARYCEVDVDLQSLGNCVVEAQQAYETILLQAHLLHDVLNGNNSGMDAARLAPAFSIPAQQQGIGLMDGSADMNHFGSRHLTPMPPSVPRLVSPLLDATHRLDAARTIVAEMLQERRPDVEREVAAQHAREQVAQESALLEREQAERRAEANGARRTPERHVEHEEGVDAELRRGLLVDSEEETLHEDGGTRTDGLYDLTDGADRAEYDDEEGDEEAMMRRYRMAGYTPL